MDVFETVSDNLLGLVFIILVFGLPIVAVVMAFIKSMNKRKLDKEIRQLIIENHTDAETAKLLIDEPKKQPRKMGPFDLGTLRTAAILLGIGLGALINWVADIKPPYIYFWLIIAFGIGIGMLCSFLVEMHLFKKYGSKADESQANENNETKE